VHVSLLGEMDSEYVDDVDDYLEANDAVGYWGSFYEQMLEQYRENFAAVVAALADTPDGVALFHCAGGKDRTGLIAALVLRLAGVSNDEIAADYALTEANLTWGWFDAAPDGGERRRRRFKQQTPAGAMSRTLRTIEERHGDVASYLRAAGVGDEQLDRLRERLVAP
jgi:protein-tyrosine phosphatase